MTDKVILSASKSFGSYNKDVASQLTAQGYKLVYDSWPPKNVAIDQVFGLVVSTQKVDAASLAAAANLKIVAKYGAGVDNIDIKAATARGIAVAVAGDANAEAVAEMALSLMMSISRNIPAADRAVKDGKWDRLVGREIFGKTVGIIGLGAIGRIFAKRISAFEVKLLGFDPFWNEDFARQYSVKRASVDEIFSEADFISIHCPLTDETRGLVNRGRLAMMKPGAYLVNTSRGPVVDEAALFEALSEKRIAGAALDVFAQEPPVDSPLFKLDNVILTSHMGAYSYEAFFRMDVRTAENVSEVLSGRTTRLIINASELQSRK